MAGSESKGQEDAETPGEETFFPWTDSKHGVDPGMMTFKIGRISGG